MLVGVGIDDERVSFCSFRRSSKSSSRKPMSMGVQKVEGTVLESTSLPPAASRRAISMVASASCCALQRAMVSADESRWPPAT